MKVFSFLLAILLCGCASDKSGKKLVERGPGGTIAYLVQVESNEPGVKIEANGDYIGDTPCTLKIFGDKDGTFHNFGQFDYVVRALPLHQGQFVQIKTFRTGGWFTPEDRIPSRLYFDMNLVTSSAAGGGAAPAPAPAPALPPVEPLPGGLRKMGSGTAFAITDDGYLISNHHVIANAERVVVVFPDERVEAKVIEKDLRNDLVVLKVFKRTSH
ncbi:MAG: S1C family serine protease [Verrucomicrobiota bacterium]